MLTCSYHSINGQDLWKGHEREVLITESAVDPTINILKVEYSISRKFGDGNIRLLRDFTQRVLNLLNHGRLPFTPSIRVELLGENIQFCSFS